ncbi:hypothetical protein JCM8097_009528 [Rhodosporidiobolus ruineniae]
MSNKPTAAIEHVENGVPPPTDRVHDTYAVDEHNLPVTVVGTMGQDPDHKQAIPWRAFVVVGLCAFAQLQNTYISVAPAANAYSVAGALGGNTGQRIWIVQALSVPSIVTGPIFGIISDLYGRRWLIISVWLMFCVSAIIAMTANGMGAVIAGQALGGICCGISGIMYAVAGEVMPSVYRAYAQTIVNACASTASVIALIAMGQACSADPVNGWRWIWRVQLIMSGILFFGFLFFYHPPPRTLIKTTWSEKIKTFDWIGYFLLIAGLVPLLMGLAFSSDSTIGWHDPHSYAPVAVGCVGLIACLLYEWKGTSTGFLDHRLFEGGRNFPLSLFLIAVEGSLFYLINNIYPSEVNGLWASPGTIDANARLLPFFLVIFVVAPGMSWYATRYKDLKWPLTIGFICFAVAMVGFAESKLNGGMATAFNAVAGIGFSAPLILLISVVQLSAPPLFIGVASALVISIRTLGGAVGYAIAEAIYGALTNDQIPAAILKAVVPLGFDPANIGGLIVGLSTGQGLATLPGATGQVLGASSAAMKAVQAHGYRITWYAFLPGAVIAAVGCALLQNPKDRMNWVTDAPLNTKEAVQGRIEAGEHADTASGEKSATA